jgi:hypothetical protein
MLGLGDYDTSSWTLSNLAHPEAGIWADASRGQVYCNWAVNPNLIDKASVALDYMYRHKTNKDTFIAWDSGAGYVNPTKLYGAREPSGYGDCIEVWREHCRNYYRKLNYSITGWLLNGDSGKLGEKDCDVYSVFSGDGIGMDQNASIEQALRNNIPVIRETWPGNPNEPKIVHYPSGVHFIFYRTILWKPSDIIALEKACSTKFNMKFLDAYSFYYLMRYHMGGKNDYRAAWVNDSMPRIMAAGKKYRVDITVRNDGWDTWTKAKNYRLTYGFVPSGSAPKYSSIAKLPGKAAGPGESVVFHVSITAPKEKGVFDFYYDMEQDGATFATKNNIEWKKTVIVARDVNEIDSDNDGCPDMKEEAAGSLYWNPDDHASGDGESL